MKQANEMRICNDSDRITAAIALIDQLVREIEDEINGLSFYEDHHGNLVRDIWINRDEIHELELQKAKINRIKEVLTTELPIYFPGY